MKKNEGRDYLYLDEVKELSSSLMVYKSTLRNAYENANSSIRRKWILKKMNEVNNVLIHIAQPIEDIEGGDLNEEEINIKTH